MAVAENRLSCDMLGLRMEAMKGTPIPADCFGYNPPRGAPRLQAVMTAYINRTFMQAGRLLLIHPASISMQRVISAPPHACSSCCSGSPALTCAAGGAC